MSKALVQILNAHIFSPVYDHNIFQDLTKYRKLSTTITKCQIYQQVLEHGTFDLLNQNLKSSIDWSNPFKEQTQILHLYR